ncbi:hypothetical protein WMW72_12065 [Paenibacillus filicis]|uniref:Uncharacterized protein n=1 Tax=Paenibacillus filicis TaxID=669464 RepID=A0ABU9DIF7_9BACL
MNLKYIGVNNRGRAEWAELDLADNLWPEGRIMEEWEVRQYRPIVEKTEKALGRTLERAELSILAWLSGMDNSTVKAVSSLIGAAYENGKKEGST